MSELIANAYSSTPAILTAFPFYAAVFMVLILAGHHKRSGMVLVTVFTLLMPALAYTLFQFQWLYQDFWNSFGRAIFRFLFTLCGWVLGGGLLAYRKRIAALVSSLDE